MSENPINMSSLHNLLEENLQELFVSKVALLYKHSSACGISLYAQSEVLYFAREHSDIPIYQVDVLEQRALSTLITTKTGIPHKSPQVILLRDGNPVWNTSHFKVRATSIAQAVESSF